MRSLWVAGILLFLVGCDRSSEATGTAGTEVIGTRHLTADDYESFIATPGKLAAVMFHAGWCEPCRKQGPIVEEVVAEFGGMAVLGMVDVDDSSELAKSLGVNGIPDLRLYRKGIMVDAMKGEVPEEQLRSHFSIQIAQLDTSGNQASDSAPVEPAIRPMSEGWRPAGMERR